MMERKFSITKDGIVNKKELFSESNTPQQYSRYVIHAVCEELGIKIEEEWEMDDDSIELTVTRCIGG